MKVLKDVEFSEIFVVEMKHWECFNSSSIKQINTNEVMNVKQIKM